MSLAVVGLVLAAALVWPGRASRVGLRGADAVGDRGPAALGWWRRVRAGRAPVEDLESLATVADLLAMALRSGATPVSAVDVVAREAPRPWREVLEEVGVQLARGGAAGAVWQLHAHDHPHLAPVAGAWSLSEDLGVALAPSMATSARVLRARVQARRRLDASTAGARATMHLLTLLPLAGLLAGFAFGLTPWGVYGHSPLTMLSVVVGLALTAAGWLVCRWVLGRAVAPREET
ncbi:type II secretion system F family protein [Janibacter sp. YB324]|uniref:type II secretion system F family protein n=1 Tax=Janibacter sp. YB324 TaxID=2761047 RepID=UPI0016253FF4|nr:type II secretion system F family protein [Janibacter sp. YB324]QNF93735.1 type II secretion system F family protein [Janibacter sp. YB324]